MTDIPATTTPETPEPPTQTIEIKRIERPVKVDQKVNDAKADALALDLKIKYKIQKYVNLGIPKPEISSIVSGWNLNGHEKTALEFLTLTAPGREIDNPDEPKKETEDDNPTLPSDAWVGIFEKYRALVAGTTEASDNFHYGGILTILGCTLAHRVSTHYAGALYPNFYICNIGGTGETRKTTAANRAIKICEKLNYTEDEENASFKMLSQFGSIEYLYDVLNGRKKVVLLFLSELGSLMAKAQQSGASNMITDLITLWDVPYHMTPSTRHLAVNCEMPFVTIIACSTLEYLYKYTSLENIYSGWANRWCFIHGVPKGAMPNPPPVDPESEKQLVKEINDIRKWSKDIPNGGILGKSQEAQEMWNEFYIDFFNAQITKTGLLPELMIRIPTIIWKIATLYAAQDFSMTIRGKDLHRAIRVGKFMERSMRRVFQGYSNTENRKKDEKVVDYLKKKGAVEIRYLYRNLNMSAEELNRIIKPLKQAGIIQAVKIGKKDGLTLG